MNLLAQSPPPLDSVPSDFIKSAMILAGFAIVIGLQVYNTFFKTQRREISGRVINEEEPVFADADDVEKLRDDVAQDKTVIGSRISEIQAGFAERMHKLGQDTLKDLSEIKSMTSRHEALIQQMERRLSSVEASHNDSVIRLHARIDDAMKRK